MKTILDADKRTCNPKLRIATFDQRYCSAHSLWSGSSACIGAPWMMTMWVCWWVWYIIKLHCNPVYRALCLWSRWRNFTSALDTDPECQQKEYDNLYSGVGDRRQFSTRTSGHASTSWGLQCTISTHTFDQRYDSAHSLSHQVGSLGRLGWWRWVYVEECDLFNYRIWIAEACLF